MVQFEFTRTDLDVIAQRLIDFGSSKSICFHGAMGVGKTTLIKALVSQLGGVDLGSSPTFGIVNEYHDSKGEPLAYHFDFYRLESEMEAYDMGLEGYFEQGLWVFMEWPEKVPSFIPANSCHVHLSLVDEKTRLLQLEEF